MNSPASRVLEAAGRALLSESWHCRCSKHGGANLPTLYCYRCGAKREPGTRTRRVVGRRLAR